MDMPSRFLCLRQHHRHNPCLTLVFSHSSNGDCFAVERMDQQPLQGFRVTLAAFLYHLDDTCASGGTEDCAAWPRVGTVITGCPLAACVRAKGQQPARPRSLLYCHDFTAARTGCCGLLARCSAHFREPFWPTSGCLFLTARSAIT